ncbi:hypothetical protein [Mycobacterium basiliense]|uniref:hypothetical protein n=1 Tax=Mycobacterium basiliense TaxID=2094119 RepID=UPI0013014326|nr:hypothetical protein [Mycobacterium basiliense]
MGRHELARKRRKPSVLLAAVIAPAAAFFAGAGDVALATDRDAAGPAVEDGPCCVEIVSAAPIEVSSQTMSGAVGRGFAARQFASASRLRVQPRFLPAGVAPERGLQVKTILVARSISAAFPEIHEIGGVRADALPWHPNGLALDVMIPNPGSAEGIELGNEIVAYMLRNSARFGMQDAIWRGVYYTPTSARRSGAGHYDHVHITTTGGGYPTGGEMYLR